MTCLRDDCISFDFDWIAETLSEFASSGNIVEMNRLVRAYHYALMDGVPSFSGERERLYRLRTYEAIDFLCGVQDRLAAGTSGSIENAATLEGLFPDDPLGYIKHFFRDTTGYRSDVKTSRKPTLGS